jgi:hypothetical protein
LGQCLRQEVQLARFTLKLTGIVTNADDTNAPPSSLDVLAGHWLSTNLLQQNQKVMHECNFVACIASRPQSSHKPN